MGWFSRNNEQPTQQFGAPTTFGASGGMGYGMQNSGMMDPMQMQMMGQNPMMQEWQTIRYRQRQDCYNTMTLYLSLYRAITWVFCLT